MVEESNQNEFLIQIDVSSFAEFEISEFEISRFDCKFMYNIMIMNGNLNVALSIKRKSLMLQIY